LYTSIFVSGHRTNKKGKKGETIEYGQLFCGFRSDPIASVSSCKAIKVFGCSSLSCALTCHLFHPPPHPNNNNYRMGTPQTILASPILVAIMTEEQVMSNPKAVTTAFLRLSIIVSRYCNNRAL